MNILLASDNALQRYKINRLLKHLGHAEVWLLDNGRDISRQVRRQPVDLLIVGRHLANGVSEDFVREFRMSPEGESVPILMMCGPITREALLKIVDAGVDDVLLYPCSSESLRRRIQKLIPHP